MTPIVQKYTRTAVVLHWTIAALILLNILGGLTNPLWPKPVDQQLTDVHKSVGLTVFGLALLRLLWRSIHPPPSLPASYRPWERRLSHATHGLLYLLMLTIPVTGYLHDSAWKEAAAHPNAWFGLIPWPRLGLLQDLDPVTKEFWHSTFFAAHEWASWALLALFVLHVGGALKHQLFDHEAELQRMTP